MSRFVPLYLVLLTLVGWRTWSNGWAATAQGPSGSREASSTDVTHQSEQVGVISGKPRVASDRAPKQNDGLQLVKLVSGVELVLASRAPGTHPDAPPVAANLARGARASEQIRAPPQHRA